MSKTLKRHSNHEKGGKRIQYTTNPNGAPASRSNNLTQSIPTNGIITIVNSDLEDTMDLDISQLKVNEQLKRKYRTLLKNKGILEFLVMFIAPIMSKQQVYQMLINLGYNHPPSKYKSVSIKKLVKILADFIINDESLKLTLPVISFGPRYTVDKFLSDLTLCSRILIVTGAGISTSLGIPDFRSFSGLYAQLDHLRLEDPQHAFNFKIFNRNPQIFFSIAHLILPPDGKVSITHDFMKVLQSKNKLLKNYTQNIDNLEVKAGITTDKLVQCHGSFASARCLSCFTKYPGSKIYSHIQQKIVPRCFNCYNRVKLNDEVSVNYGVIKPDITFFGEDLPKLYYKSIKQDISQCDMIIVIGTSLKVEPVASIVDRVAKKVPKILINRDAIPDRDFDLTFLGDCDNVTSYISQRLGSGWKIPNERYNPQQKLTCEVTDLDENIYRVSSP